MLFRRIGGEKKIHQNSSITIREASLSKDTQTAPWHLTQCHRNSPSTSLSLNLWKHDMTNHPQGQKWRFIKPIEPRTNKKTRLARLTTPPLFVYRNLEPMDFTKCRCYGDAHVIRRAVIDSICRSYIDIPLQPSLSGRWLMNQLTGNRKLAFIYYHIGGKPLYYRQIYQKISGCSAKGRGRRVWILPFTVPREDFSHVKEWDRFIFKFPWQAQKKSQCPNLHHIIRLSPEYVMAFPTPVQVGEYTVYKWGVGDGGKI